MSNQNEPSGKPPLDADFEYRPGAPLYWLKTSDPDASVPDVDASTDVRVLLPDDARFLGLRDRLTDVGAAVRTVRYWIEQELVTNLTDDGGTGSLTVRTDIAYAGRRPVTVHHGRRATVAREAFDELWRTHEPGTLPQVGTVNVDDVVPASWRPLLPHGVLNPAQAQAAPAVLESDDHLLVVAPTGAGKTTIGMLAALRAILGGGGKAAWLVPQRSLTDELDRQLEGWRARGLRVARLSGEYSVDVQRVRQADLWVTTTEKFEVLSRTESLRAALAEVGCLIVDEIHLLGDPERGPVLEALLLRVRDEDSRVRMVGLSATVSNAEQVAAWLNARLVRLSWRPSRLTWQLPTVPAFANWQTVQAARTRMTNRIVDLVTADGGSVVVFCGSKFSVRSTALAIAASRGVPTAGIRPDDVDAVRGVCEAAGVGLHYKDWEYKRQAEHAFRERRTNVLVATSTMAAGVNLPARAVVVRDTAIGRREVDVATVQQMFGRAGRAGQGEDAGWAFMIVDESERHHWQRSLVGGYTVDSQIGSSLADHVLAEIVQGRIRTVGEAEQWWLRTFAHHQGRDGIEQLRQAVRFLVGAEYCRELPADDGQSAPAARQLAATDLGVLTTRVMMPPLTGYHLRSTLAGMRVPEGPDEAEDALVSLLSTAVGKLAGASLAESVKPAVAAVLHLGGRLPPEDTGPRTEPPDLPGDTPYAPGDLARAALLMVAFNPTVFEGPPAELAGIPLSALTPVLEQAPRYLHWLAAQGHLGTVHPWAAIVAADLNRRVRWRRCGPPRGSGRLLWMCEQMATPAHMEQDVPQMWRAARAQGVVSPDWRTRTPPSGSRLDPQGYGHLLQERVAAGELTTCTAEGPAQARKSRTLTTWDGPVYRSRSTAQKEWTATGDTGVALFSWRGDYRATGWLTYYSAIAADPTTTEVSKTSERFPVKGTR